MLQVLLLAVLSGIALAMFRDEPRLIELSESLSHFFFKIVALVMEAAPIGAFGAMAFTIGRYGVANAAVAGQAAAVLLCDQHRIYSDCAGHDLLDEWREPLAFSGVYPRGAADRAGHFVVGGGIAAADAETRKYGLPRRRSRGWWYQRATRSTWMGHRSI